MLADHAINPRRCTSSAAASDFAKENSWLDIPVAGRGTVVGTNVRAIASLFDTAAGGFTIREISVANTTAVAVCVGVIRFSAATNVGTGLTEVQYDPTSFPAALHGFCGTHGRRHDGGRHHRASDARRGGGLGLGVDLWR